MAENFPIMQRNLNIQFHEPQGHLGSFTQKWPSPRRLFKPKIINNFKAAREINIFSCKENLKKTFEQVFQEIPIRPGEK